jgi:hypothetical protein
VTDELAMVDGIIALHRRPGCGVAFNRDAVERFKEAAERATPTLITA